MHANRKSKWEPVWRGRKVCRPSGHARPALQFECPREKSPSVFSPIITQSSTYRRQASINDKYIDKYTGVLLPFAVLPPACLRRVYQAVSCLARRRRNRRNLAHPLPPAQTTVPSVRAAQLYFASPPALLLLLLLRLLPPSHIPTTRMLRRVAMHMSTPPPLQRWANMAQLVLDRAALTTMAVVRNRMSSILWPQSMLP